MLNEPYRVTPVHSLYQAGAYCAVSTLHPSDHHTTMSMVMVTLMTFVVTAINTCFTEGFTSRWGKAILIAWPVGFAVCLIDI